MQQVQYPVPFRRTEITYLMKRINNNKQQKKKSNRNKPRRNQGPAILVVPRSVGAIVPDQFATTLKWWKSYPVNLLTLAYNSFRVNASGAYDPDPAGDSIPSGFKQFAELYTSYKVTSSRIRVQVINPDQEVPVTVNIVPVNLDPGSTPTSNYVISSFQQPYAKNKMIAPRGAPAIALTSSMSTQKMFGNKMTLYDDNFTALTNANPINMWFWFIGFYAPAVHTTSAVVANIFVEMDIRFYDRRVLNNSL